MRGETLKSQTPKTPRFQVPSPKPSAPSSLGLGVGVWFGVDYLACAAARSAGATPMRSACAATWAFTSASAAATAAASPAAIRRVRLDEPLLAGRRRLLAVVDSGHRTGGHARPAVDTFFGMDVKNARCFELRFVLPRMDAVHRADVHAGGVLRINARVGDDERHSGELTQKAAGLGIGTELPAETDGKIST